MNGDDAGNEDDVDCLYLEPAAWPRNGQAEWKATGRTMIAGVSPVGGETIAWVSKKVSSLCKRLAMSSDSV